jgi:Ran GTPase-activating protein (RanGAP) involved in mRNA processing and transport
MGSMFSLMQFIKINIIKVYQYLFVKLPVSFTIRNDMIIDITELNIPKNTTRLLCIKNTFSSEMFKQFLIHLSNYKNLTTLYFNYINMHNAKLHYINMISNLQVIIITMCHDINILSLFAGIHKLKIKTLVLSHNKINKINDIPHICNGLRHFANSLEILDLSGNLFGDNGIYNLCHALQYLKKLKKLCISNNNITNNGLLLLIDILPELKYLENLEIDRNDITSSIYESLTITLNKLPNIQKVDIDKTIVNNIAWEDIPEYYILCS